MSTLPTNIVGTVLQSTLVQRQVSASRDTERASSAVDLRQQATIIDEKGSTVETTDGDTQVYSDAEGTGSQLEINDSQSALTRAQVNRLGALYDYYIRLADFEKSIGKAPDKYIRYAEEIHGDS